ncbi:MAG TPA: glycoside hydrolase family 9 protein, partial [Puia sp.]|nr:glycoside hydrolase family 9 protein [Puia sp.]
MQSMPFTRGKLLLVLSFWTLVAAAQAQDREAWIRINQLGYTPHGVKVAVLASAKGFGAAAAVSSPAARSAGTHAQAAGLSFELVDSISQRIVFTGSTGKPFGSYGPFVATWRLDFSSYRHPGTFFLRVGPVSSPVFSINEAVYDGAADFCLRYMRQQRSGWNPFLQDSCHTHDGYTLNAPVPDSTHIDVVGGWHDASDYLQYSTTSANAAWHLLAASRDFPGVFADERQANGGKGKNNIPDVLDEAKWGLDWLLKMHPKDNWLFNQLGDDRDHKGMRIPKEDSNYYGRGLERPVYF